MELSIKTDDEGSITATMIGNIEDICESVVLVMKENEVIKNMLKASIEALENGA
jgi:hypothetical protein